jgi:translation initiation factor 5
MFQISMSSQDAKKKKKSKDDSDEEEKKAKKEKKKDKKSKKEKKETEDGEELNGHDKDYIKEALAGGKKTDDDLLANGHDNDDDDDDEDDSDDVSEAGVDDAGALQLAVDATSKFIKDTPSFTNEQLIELITNQQMASALKSHDKVHILIEAAITDKFFKNNEIKRFAPSIIGITNKNKIMERHLIAALEKSCVDKPKNFPVMIKLLYDEDALQEETILEWADEGRSEYTIVDEDHRAILRGEAEPVVVWLQDSDSEDDDDDEE